MKDKLMLDIVVNAIDQYYKKKNHTLFKACCAKSLSLFQELRNYIELHKLTLIEGPDKKTTPARSWYIKYKDYKQGEFEVSYKTILKISKLVPVFYVHHEFDVKSKDNNCIEQNLGGFSDQAYTKQQLSLHDKIKEILVKNGYKELSYTAISEAIQEFKMPETHFWPDVYVTVDDLLFRDIYTICSEE